MKSAEATGLKSRHSKVVQGLEQKLAEEEVKCEAQISSSNARHEKVVTALQSDLARVESQLKEELARVKEDEEDAAADSISEKALVAEQTTEAHLERVRGLELEVLEHKGASRDASVRLAEESGLAAAAQQQLTRAHELHREALQRLQDEHNLELQKEKAKQTQHSQDNHAIPLTNGHATPLLGDRDAIPNGGDSSIAMIAEIEGELQEERRLHEELAEEHEDLLTLLALQELEKRELQSFLEDAAGHEALERAKRSATLKSKARYGTSTSEIEEAFESPEEEAYFGY